MAQLKGSCVIAQSGGPTSVINSSVYGVIKEAQNHGEIDVVYGALHGIKGILNDQLVDLSKEDAEQIELLTHTPAAALGSCRYKLKPVDVDDTDYLRILEIFKKYNIRYFFYNGGNDSMDTCNKISKFINGHGYECRVIGIPKTIDNDLYGTDHCPGFASAAKYIATTCMEIYHDSIVYDYGTITVVEIMGRHAGWLAASSAIATHFGAGPDLIYLPEKIFDIDKFMADVKRIYDKKGKCLVAVSEGIHNKEGKLIAETFMESVSRDAFGHVQLGGIAASLAGYIKKELGCKTRGIEFSLMQRCAAHSASQIDVDEAVLAGRAAVKYAIDGITDKMVAFECDRTNGYTCKTVLLDLADVANYEKKIPDEWINDEGNGLKQPFIDYVLPLIQGEARPEFVNGVPKFAKLKKEVVK